MAKQYVCIYHLVAPVSMGHKSIPAGTPFEETWLAESNFRAFVAAGAITEYVPPVEEVAGKKNANKMAQEAQAKADAEAAKAKAKAQAEAEAQAKADAASQPKKEAPKGIFCFPANELSEMGLDELNTLFVDICTEHNLPFDGPFETVEDAIAKLSSEA